MRRPSFRHLLVLTATAATFLVGAGSLLPQTAPPPVAGDVYASKVQPLLVKYCYKCHGPQLQPKAQLNLSKYATEASIRDSRKLWKDILVKTYTREMPPEDAQPQPSAEERETITKFLEAALDKVDPSAPRNAGRTTTKRLNKIEYRLTVKDLLGVEFDVKQFPSDDVGYGFDNIGDVLSLPPLLMEKYLEASRRIVEEAVKGPQKDKLVFTVKPGPAEAGKPPKPNREVARELLARLGMRAFRRPVMLDELDRLLKLFDLGEKQESGDFEKAMKLPIRGLLISPYFLFRVEFDNPAGGEASPLSAFEIASRLSYFLWSTMPDEELFDLAKTGKLLNPKTLEEQVARMLKSPKATAFAEHFTPQWLQIRRLEEMKFDRARFPGYDAPLGQDMIKETVLFFEAVMREDLSLMTFLDSDFTFVNARLAQLYGIPAAGAGFTRVKLSDGRRGGILTMGAVLAATSDPDRTSLVKRGKWVLETILATPPPPPVPDAANLSEDPANARLPLRQRMEKHRADPNCASCHKRMDPIGFGFENYDAIGQWRDQDQGKPVDSAAELPDGKKFNGPVELKKVLKEQKAAFVEGLAEKMLTYALGRGVEHFDGLAVKQIVDATAKKEYKFSAFILEVVKSYPFQYRQKDRGKR